MLQNIIAYVAARLAAEDGISAIEYGLMAVFIALVMVGGATALGISLDALFNNIAGQLN